MIAIYGIYGVELFNNNNNNKMMTAMSFVDEDAGCCNTRFGTKDVE